MDLRAFIAEFIGTFALVFIGAGAVALGTGGLVGAALAHGFVVIAFAYAYGRFSGCHLNPAITLALFLVRQLSIVKAVVYMVAQCAGGIAAAFVLQFVLGGAQSGLGATNIARGVTVEQAIVLEALLTFFLANTVLHTVVRKSPSPHAPLAIGFTLCFCILCGGPLTGASLNPARTLGPALVLGQLSSLWVYCAGPAAGAALAALLRLFVLRNR